MERRAFLTTGLALGAVGVGGARGRLGAVPQPMRLAGPLRLDSNENPLGLAPAARQAITDGLDLANRYPGQTRSELIEALAEKHDVSRENIVLGCGSTEVLQMIVQAAAAAQSRIVLAQPTFEAVVGYARPHESQLLPTPLDQRYAHDIEQMRRHARAANGPVLVYLCNPNNPTGTITPSAEIDAWIEEAPEQVRFLVDEAYIEYVDDARYWSSLKWIASHPNVIVVRTFSKIYGMAGMRLGYGIAHPDTAAELKLYMSDSNANYLALVAGLASLRDRGLVPRGQETNARGREILYQTLQSLDLEYLPSSTNFVMHRIRGDLRSYIDRMDQMGVWVGRPFPPMLEYNRVSIGLPEEMERFAEILRSFRSRDWI
jgi:histidinol-phosphate aminotransferase